MQPQIIRRQIYQYEPVIMLRKWEHEMSSREARILPQSRSCIKCQSRVRYELQSWPVRVADLI